MNDGKVGPPSQVTLKVKVSYSKSQGGGIFLVYQLSLEVQVKFVIKGISVELNCGGEFPINFTD